jgi:membrane protease subunit HflC
MKSSLLFGTLAALLVLFNSVFIVNEAEHAILFQFGAVKRADFEPGLHFKAPFVQNVRKFDNRLLSVEAEPERYLTSERKDVLVDFYVKWRIDDVAAFYQATTGDEQQAIQRLIAIVREPLRQAFNERTLQALVADRGTVINQVVRNADEAARSLGIDVVDVRIIRIDLPEEVSESVFRRMRAERQQVANDLRATGQEAAETIRSDADRQVAVILAEARGDAARIRGEGEAEAAAIFNRAFASEPAFFEFTRSLEAYRESFKGKDGVLVMDRNSEFFRHFGNDRIR